MMSVSLPRTERGDPAQKRRIVGLIRVSTADQARDGRGGIPRQRRVIEDTIKRKDLDCLRIYEISDLSGTRVRHHPDIQEILRLVATKVVTGLVVADLDRLFRPDEPTDYAILQNFKDTGAIIYSGDTEYDLGSKDGMLFSGIRSAISAWELGLMNERQKGACEAKRRMGHCPTNALTLPLGLSFDREQLRFYYNEKIVTVIELFRLYDSGVRNYHELERRTGVRHRTAYNLLQNPFVTGWRVFDKKRGEKVVSRTGKAYRKKCKRTDDVIRVKIINTPAVSQECFDRVQAAIRQTTFNHHETRKRNDTCNLGTGLARCGYCAETFYSSSGRRTSHKRSGQYFCKRNYYVYRDKLGGCRQLNLRQPELDALILAFAVKTLTNADTLTAIINDSVRRAHETISPFPVDATAEIGALRRADKRLLEAFEAGGAITVDELRDRRSAIRTQIEAISRRNTDRDARDELGIEELAKKVVRGAFRLKRLNNDPHAQKAIILAAFSEIFVKDSSIIAFKLREDFGVGNQVKLAAGFSTPPIHLPEPFTLEPDDPLPDGMRRCSCCRKIFPAADFYTRKGQCRRCIAAKAHEAYLRRRSGPDA